MSLAHVPDRAPSSARPSPPVPRLALSRQEAAQALGVSVDYFDQHIISELRVVRCGRRKLVPVKELERWLSTNAALALRDERPSRCP